MTNELFEELNFYSDLFMLYSKWWDKASILLQHEDVVIWSLEYIQMVLGLIYVTDG